MLEVASKKLELYINQYETKYTAAGNALKIM